MEGKIFPVQDPSGNLITTGVNTVDVYQAGTTTHVPIYSSDSLAAGLANPFTVPTIGALAGYAQFYARNQAVDIKITTASFGTITIPGELFDAGAIFNTFANRPAFGSADLLFFSTDTGVIYRDTGTAWELYPDFSKTAIPLSALALSAIPNGTPMFNGNIVASVSGSALTFAIKTMAGNDPSASDPVYISFRSATATLADTTTLAIVAATSFTVSNGSTLGAVNGVPFRGWLVAFNDGGTFRIAVINCLQTSLGSGGERIANSIYPLMQQAIASATNEGGAGAADNVQVFYTNATVTSKAYTLLGHFSYESGLASAGVYASVPTRLDLYRAGMYLPGQTVQDLVGVSGATTTGSTQIPNDNTQPQNTEGDQYLSLAITPSSAANVLELSGEVSGAVSASGATTPGVIAIFQDSTVGALLARYIGWTTNAYGNSQSWFMKMLAAVNVATTFKTRIGPSAAATFTFNGEASANRFGGIIFSHTRIKEIMA